MGWYYYTGSTIRAIPVAKGRSVAVRPRTKFEVFEETRELQMLAKRNVVRKASGPKSPKPKGAVPKISEKDIPLPEFSRSVAEKGVTTSKNKPPKPNPVDGSEMTEDEAHSVVEDGDDKKGKGKKGKK